MSWESVADYQPKAESDEFGIIKANGLECSVEYARIETYSGSKPELQGVQFFRYELSVIGGTTDFIGRKFWASFRLDDDKQLKKLKDLFFTALNVVLASQADLENNLEPFASQVYVVRAWGWKPDNADEPKQMHVIKSVRKDSGNTNSAAF